MKKTCLMTGEGPWVLVNGTGKSLAPAGQVTGSVLPIAICAAVQASSPWAADAGFFPSERCELPTPEEWLAAATTPGFEVGPAYELVKSPWSAESRRTRADEEEIVAAEGALFEGWSITREDLAAFMVAQLTDAK